MSETYRPESAVAVIGLATRVPGASDAAGFWANLRAGVESVVELDDTTLLARGADPAWLSDPRLVRRVVELADIDRFDAGFFGMSPGDAAILDPQHRLFLECCWRALEDAGCVPGAGEESIGVYAAASLSGYLIGNLLRGQVYDASPDSFRYLLGNDKDYLATRVAYTLGLDGPALSVQTACSSSLVAVHLAAQALLTHECDVALAGGVTVRVPHGNGYLYQEGSIFSSDGHCRPFDARATGTTIGSGAGVVVLKRLVDAVADGDRVDAVLIGSALANDGSAKAGYTAPGVLGQARTVAAALAVAGVTPDEVDVIEAHGTGTPLGDPIEVAALRRVFGDGANRSAPCLIGSVKSNFGHLDSAAGIAAFAKAVLQLRAGEVAPSLNFGEPNPEIDFGEVFAVPTEATPWPGRGPRRIGVSSFGFGGTNVHAVLQQAPEPPPAGPARPVHVLALSARDSESLDGATDDLAAALTGSPAETDLGDVARTLQTGRTPFRHRRIAIVDSAGGASGTADALSTRDARRVFTRRAPADPPPLCWLLPGQGSQYPGMGAGLYRDEPVFREVIDTCAEAVLDDLGGADLRALIAEGADPATLRQTRHAQPALFATEVAVAALLRSWGVAPTALLGHSVGELVAAHLAGVLSLPDAARVVAARGRLMQDCPPGAMVAVGLPVDALRERLPEGLVPAAANAPELSVVSGPADAVAEFAERLRQDGVSTRDLHTSHAFHSPMMRGAADRFARAFDGVTLSAPTVPVLSNPTGTWLTDEQATDPAYWARQLLAPVRFADGVAAIAERHPGAAWVEVGPGHALTSLVRTHPAARGAALVPLLRAAGEEGDDAHAAATAAGRLWMSGVDVDWAAIDGGVRRRRVALPGHRLRKDRHWVDADPASGPVPAPPEPTADTAASDDAATGDRPDLEVAYRAPGTGLERAIAAIWSDLLGVRAVGADDPFLELGGHSLLAIKVVQRVEADLGVAIPLRKLVHAGTVAEVAVLAAELGAADPRTTDPAAAPRAEVVPAAGARPEDACEPFPLTGIQQAQWIGRQGSFALGNVAAHVYFEVAAQDLDLPRLRAAWRAVERRHAMLDAVITPEGLQRICSDVGPYEIRVVDLSAPDADQEGGVAGLREQLSHEMRDIHNWPLYEIVVALLPDGAARVFLSFDLLIADIGSIRLLLRDWGRAYASGPDVLGPLGITYRDYVLAAEGVRNTPEHATSLAYWRERVGELPAAPNLPLVTRPADITAPRFGTHSRLLPQPTWLRLVDQGARRGLTPSSVLLAAYGAALGRWTRERCFTVNVTVTNRHPVHPDVEDLVGEFASFDLLPVDLAGGTLAEVGAALRDQSWTDLEHRHVDGMDVLRELARRGGQGGMPVVFTSTLVQQAEGPGEALLGWLGEIVHEAAQTPQVWLDGAAIQVAGGVYLSWLGVDALFPDGLLDTMLDRFVGLLERMADGEGWDERPVLPLPDGDRALVEAANDTAGPVPDGLLGDRVWRRVREHPDDRAVVAADAPGGMTFGELGAHAADLAHRLRALGAGPGQYVAVACAKGAAQVAAALGVLASGAPYLPMDPDAPRSRRERLLDRAGCRVVVTSADTAAEWPDGVSVLVVDPARTPQRRPAPEVLVRPTDPAYVIFTSGSTGEPKGVVVSHRAAVNTCVDVCERFGVGVGDAVLGLSALSFDLSVWDVFGALGAGATLVLPGEGDRRDPATWLELVREHGVTIWNSVPALATMFAEHVLGLPDADPVPVRLAMLSGDWIPLDLPGKLRAIAPDVRVMSLGGATEAAIWSITHEVDAVDPGWDSVPYGKPMRNQTFHVLDEALDECAVHVAGELYIGGVGLAEGYLGDPEKSAERFIRHPRTGERLYRTGDLGRWRPEGHIEFLGREDNQVKVGGFRIELGEIEAAMTRHPAVAASVAAAPGDRHHRRLVGYLVPEADTDRDRLVDDVGEHLRGELPAYLVPPTLVVLDRLPLTANGKVDRSALPDPAATAATAPGDGGPADSAAAELLGRVVAETLGLESVDIDRGFLEVGGDSIRAVQVTARAGAEGLAIALQDLFEQPTLRAAAALAVPRPGGGAATGVPIPLTPHQRGADRAAWARVPLDRQVSAEEVTAAATALLAATPALRLRREDDVQVVTDPEPAYVPVVDLSALPGDRQRRVLTAMLAEMTEELDPAGTVAQAAVFELGDEQAVYWLAHDFAADAASLPLLAERTAALLAGGPPPTPSTATVEWLRALDDHAPAPPPPPGEPGEPAGAGLDAAETERLARVCADAYRMTLGEACFAALALVLPEPAPCQVRIDGRGALPDVDATDHIGPFTLAGSLTAPAVHAPASELFSRAKSALRGLGHDAGEVAVGFHFAGAAPLPEASAGPVMTAAVVDGELRFAWNAAHGGRDASALAEATAEALRAIARHCTEVGAGMADAADFPLAGLDDGELATVLSGLSDGGR